MSVFGNPGDDPLVLIYLNALCARGWSNPTCDPYGASPPNGFDLVSLWPVWCRAEIVGLNPTLWAQHGGCGQHDCFPPINNDGVADPNSIHPIYGVPYSQLCQISNKFCEHPGTQGSGLWSNDNTCAANSDTSWLRVKGPKNVQIYYGVFPQLYPEFDPISRQSLRYEPDRNGTYILARPDIRLKPEIITNIERSAEPPPEENPKTAELLFEVERRAIVGFDEENYPPDWQNPPEYPLDEIWWYAVDNRCFRDPEFYVCTLPLGTAKPHLIIKELENSGGASFTITLSPIEFLPDANAIPTMWEVASVEIENPGNGLPEPPIPLIVQYDDDDLTGKHVEQEASVVITALDENGGASEVQVTAGGKYTRYLCHPHSVAAGGSHYKVGDSIEFVCAIPDACNVMNVMAHGTVSDVDENGAILDWDIAGSVVWFDYFWATSDFCEFIPRQPDDRGVYARTGIDLCALQFVGYHVVRAAGSQYRQNICETGFHPIIVEIVQIDAFTNVQIYCGEAYDEQWMQFFEPYSDLWLQMLFQPFPPCTGSGAQAEPVIEEGANQSVIGGKIKEVTVLNGGAGYAYMEVQHEEPYLPAILDSRGAVLSYTFEEVQGFPRLGLTYYFPEGYVLPPKRYSYYFVKSAEAIVGGAGYSVGEEFVISPEPGSGGGAVVPNSDDPDLVPNGTYYDGLRCRIGQDTRYFPLSSSNVVPPPFRDGLPTLKITAVDENGGITGIEPMPNMEGMLYRPVEVEARRHPAAGVTAIDSTPGYGAYFDMIVDLDKDSPTFGAVMDINVVAPPAGTPDDPLFPGSPMPVGGRDYVSQDTNKISVLQVGPENGIVQYRLMAGQTFGLDPWNPNLSTTLLWKGQRPPYIPWSKIMVTDAKCPNDLLYNKTYTLYEEWSSNTWHWTGTPFKTPGEEAACTGWGICPPPGTPIPEACRSGTGTMQNPWCVVRRGDMFYSEEWGMTIHIQSQLPGEECVKDQFKIGSTIYE